MPKVSLCSMTIVGFLLCPLHEAKASDRIVSVYYYPWYGPNIHWQEGYLRGKLLPAQAPLLGQYDSRDTLVIHRHLTWSQSYGIDNWICSWWGPDSYEDVTIRTRIAPTMQAYNTTYCLFYEAAGLLNLQNGQILFDSAKIATFRSHFVYIATNYFSDPKYHRINNRPVVYIYLTRTFAGSYAQALQSVRQDMLERGYDIYVVGDEAYWGPPNQTRIGTLDAVTAYNMHGPPQYAGYPSATNFLSDVASLYSQYFTVAKSVGVDFIPNTMPGFNDRGVRLGANHYVISNQFHPDSSHVSTFSQFTTIAINSIDSSLNAVAVTSFNEWHEDTQIEPTNVAPPTNADTSPSGTTYTLGFSYEGYGTQLLNVVRVLLSNLPPVSLVEKDALSSYFGLEQNYPNPFNPSTVIRFSLPRREFATITIFNLLGEEITTLVSEKLSPGTHQAKWNARGLPSGVYLYRLNADTFVQTKKLILLK